MQPDNPRPDEAALLDHLLGQMSPAIAAMAQMVAYGTISYATAIAAFADRLNEAAVLASEMAEKVFDGGDRT